MHLFLYHLYSVPSDVLSAVYALSYYISTVTIRNRDCFSVIINSIDNNVAAEVQRSNLPKVTKLVSGGVMNLSEESDSIPSAVSSYTIQSHLAMSQSEFTAS